MTAYSKSREQEGGIIMDLLITNYGNRSWGLFNRNGRSGMRNGRRGGTINTPLSHSSGMLSHGYVQNSVSEAFFLIRLPARDSSTCLPAGKTAYSVSSQQEGKQLRNFSPPPFSIYW